MALRRGRALAGVLAVAARLVGLTVRTVLAAAGFIAAGRRPLASVLAGVRFALQLRDAIANGDWAAHGLPRSTAIRIGMHTGPVFRAFDPLIKRDNFFGSHVVRAARIEPVAAPGSIYVSAELAAVLAARGVREFAADYLGALPLAKGYGSGRLFRLRNADEAE